MSLSKSLTAAAGNAAAGNPAAGDNLYVEDVFSTYLYDGTGASHTITNGIDLDGEGGMVWIKNRTSANWNVVEDTNRGATKTIYTNSTNAEATQAQHITSFNSDGFTAGTDNDTNASGEDYASWTFRKAEKFFDVVTYTGNGTLRTIPHNLGSTPAVIIIKQTNSSRSWVVYHESLGATKSIYLEQRDGENFNGSLFFNSTAPTSTEFTVSGFSWVNGASSTYVAYLFASDAGGFGDDGSESIIKCGSFTASAGTEVDLGFEPQWVLLRSTTNVDDWYMFDNMRGWGADRGSNDSWFLANTSGAEFNNTNSLGLTPTGFTSFNAAGQTYIYIAIRRPMKTPTVGTEVFAPTAYNGTEPTPQYLSTGFTVDFNLYKYRNLNIGASAWDRLRGGNNALTTSSSNAEEDISGNSASQIIAKQFERNDGFSVGTGANNAGTPLVAYSFKRAPGFMDVVAYTGTSSARTVNHNLGVVPELMILKVRNRAGSSWVGYHKDLGNEGGFTLTNSAAFSGVTSAWNSTTPTSSVFTLGTGSNYNGNTDNLIAYLFATLAGVSKVGSYTGTGSNVDVDCGFSAGARFILIKRSDSTGDWYVWDSVRGIVAGNDPYFLLNSTAAQVTSTDYIDPLSSGFTVTSSAPAALNASGGTYIFLAIA
jgi:hypothetical protein